MVDSNVGLVTGRPSLDSTLSSDDFRALVFSLGDRKVLYAIKRNLERLVTSTSDLVEETTYDLADFEIDADRVTAKVVTLALKQVIEEKQSELDEQKRKLNKLLDFRVVLEERVGCLL